jgi:diguanylate cyclase (GGDEF)-like protein
MTAPKLQDPALAEVLAALHGRLGLERWIATRCEGEDLIVVASHGEGLDLEAGARIPWLETVCARMASQDGPRAAPDLAGVPAYADAPMAVRLGLRAYLGVSIWSGDSVLGTLAGLDREPQDAGLVDAVPLVELCAALIGRLWDAERDARTDPLTGLWNRRAWAETLTSEEERCRRFGHAAAVLGIDLDGFKEVNDRYGHAAGDEHLRRAAAAIAGGVREHDSVARWGGDEFCVLAVECDELSARRLCGRVREALAAAGVPASLGLALRGPEGLRDAVNRALAGTAEEKGSTNGLGGDHV